MLKPCEILRSKMGDLFECSQHDRLIRIRTPFLYPDGDIIDLFLSTPDLPTDGVSVHHRVLPPASTPVQRARLAAPQR